MSRLFHITLLPQGRCIPAPEGISIQQALLDAGIRLDAPCGGHGSCGKCRCLLNGQSVLTCQTTVSGDCTLLLPENAAPTVLTDTGNPDRSADGTARYVFAADIGSTTVAAWLLDGQNGSTLATVSSLNPQTAYGGDVISRIQYVLSHPQTTALRDCIRGCLSDLVFQASALAQIAPEQIMLACLVGNPAMHHLLLGADVHSLTKPPYMPSIREQMEIPSFLPLHPDAVLRLLPNIAGFVGSDTVACLCATAFDTLEDLTLLIDIGTNGEMVLGNRVRRIACSTAAGPAFEGARIHFGMRGAPGAIDHVWLEDGVLRCSVLGGGPAQGLCGSGLLDAVWVLRRGGFLDASGRMLPHAASCERWSQIDGLPAFHLQDGVFLTQKDVREFQLAKAAIRAGIELLTQRYGAENSDIRRVLLAGAFGTYLRPEATCELGMLPPSLLSRIVPIGNAAGEGARRCALCRRTFLHTAQLAAQTEFLELASCPDFSDCYVDSMSLGEEC